MTLSRLFDAIGAEHYTTSPGFTFNSVSYSTSEGFRDIDLSILLRLLVSSIIFAFVILLPDMPALIRTVLVVVAIFIVAIDIFLAAINAVFEMRFMHKAIPLTVLAFFAILIQKSEEALAMFIIYQIMGLIVEYAYNRTAYSLKSAIIPTALSANVVDNERIQEVPIHDVSVGDIIAIHPNELIPCDCIVLEGTSTVDMSNFGIPDKTVSISEGDEVYSGSVNTGSDIRCEVTMTASESTAQSIISSCLESVDKGSPLPECLKTIVNFFAPIVLLLAVILIPALYYTTDLIGTETVGRALNFFIVANPAALIIAVPLIHLASVSWAAKNGVLFSSLDALNASSSVNTIILDRESCLAEGSPELLQVKSEKMDTTVFLKICAHAFAYSSSKQAKSIIAAYGDTIYIDLVEDFHEDPGEGVSVSIENIKILAGRRDYLLSGGVFVPYDENEENEGEVTLYVSIANEYAGKIILSDSLREDAEETVNEIADLCVKRVVSLSSENKKANLNILSQLGIEDFYCDLSDEQKKQKLSEIINQSQPSDILLFLSGKEANSSIGEDADLRAQICTPGELSMGKRKELTFFNDKLQSLPFAIRIALRSKSYVYLICNGVLLGKALILIMATIGMSNIWFSMLLDMALAIAAVLASFLPYGKDYIR